MKCRFSGSLGPELPARKPGSFAQRFQLRPHHRRMHAAIERPLRKAAIGAGDHVLAADNTRQARNALGHQLRMLTTLVAWLMTPGISTCPAPSFAFFHT